MWPPKNISIKDSEGIMLVSAHASTVYAVWRIKSKTKNLYFQPNLTLPNRTKPKTTQFIQTT
jgi:hypothetical protein